jgi:hypothetical protein
VRRWAPATWLLGAGIVLWLVAQALPAASIALPSDGPDPTEEWIGFGFTLLGGLLSIICLPLFPAVGLLGIVGWTANFWLAVALVIRLREGLEKRLFIATVLGMVCAVAGVGALLLGMSDGSVVASIEIGTWLWLAGCVAIGIGAQRSRDPLVSDSRLVARITGLLAGGVEPPIRPGPLDDD